MAELPRRPPADALLEAALACIRNGRPVFPVKKDKAPLIPKWKGNATLHEAKVREWFGPDTNAWGVAVPMGDASGLLTADVDSHGTKKSDALAGARKLCLEKHETRIHETANGGRHDIYRYPKQLKIGNPSPHAGIDVRGEGGYIVWADGVNYHLINDVEPAELPAELASALTSKKPYCGRVDATPTREQVRLAATGESFHNPLTSIAARLAGSGVRPSETSAIVYGLADVALRFTQGERRDRVAKAVEEGEIERIIESAHAKFAPFPEDDDYLFDPWQEYPRTPPPLDALPKQLAELVDAVSKASGVDPSAALISALMVASAAISAECYTCPAANQPDWRARPILWGMIVGGVSAGKSPAAKTLIGPLHDLERKLRREYRDRHGSWSLAGELARHDDERFEEPEPAEPPMLVVTDATKEALARELAKPEQENRGGFLWAEEIEQLLGGFGQYSGKASADRAFWLQTWDGGPQTITRVGGARGGRTERMFVERPAMSILGTIQPAKIRSRGRDIAEDGLLQRFLPVLLRDRVEADDSVDLAGPLAWWKARLEAMFRLEGKEIEFEDRTLVREIEQRATALSRCEGLFGAGFASWAGKLVSQYCRLCLVVACIKGEEVITRETARQVYDLVMKWLVPNAMSFYDMLTGSRDHEDVRGIAAWIIQNYESFDEENGKKILLQNRLTKGPRATRGLSQWDLNQKLSPLVAGGWLNPLDKQGSIATKWVVNPAVMRVFAERAAEEARQRDEVRKLISHSAGRRGAMRGRG